MTGLLTCCFAVPAIAQQGDQDQSQRRRQADQQSGQRQDGQRQDGQRQDGQRQDGQRQDGQRQDGDQARQGDRPQQQRRSQLRAEPQGWVRMAVDYDQDGRYDAIETIYVYDLEVAQRRSQQRKQQQGAQQQGAQQQGAQQQRQGQMSRSRRSGETSSQTRQVQGEIHDMQKIRMHDGEDRYVVARVRTQQGRTAKVLLGREDQLSQLDLSDGDRVEVQGRTGRLNDRSILVANRVRSGDQQVSVAPKQMQRPVKQVKGEVVRTRTARFRGHDGAFVVAEVRTDDGQRQLVNMGQKSKLDDVDLKQGTQVRLLASPGKVDGRQALIAEQVSVDGETIKIKPQQRRDRQWSRQQQSADRQQGRQQSGRQQSGR